MSKSIKDLNMNEALAILKSRDVTAEQKKELEEKISKCAYSSYHYAKDIIKGRFALAENVIAKSKYAAQYAVDVIKARWEEAEEFIAKSSLAPFYAQKLINKRWKDGEKQICNNPLVAWDYYKRFRLRFPRNPETYAYEWPEAEESFKKKPSTFWKYVRYNGVVNKNFENLILSDPTNKKYAGYVYQYCTRILKSRWLEAESIILNNPDYAIRYCSKFNIELPTSVHNRVLAEVAVGDSKSATKKNYIKRFAAKKKIVANHLIHLLEENEITRETTVAELLGER
jgi:hypothetical protein